MGWKIGQQRSAWAMDTETMFSFTDWNQSRGTLLSCFGIISVPVNIN